MKANRTAFFTCWQCCRCQNVYSQKFDSLISISLLSSCSASVHSCLQLTRQQRTAGETAWLCFARQRQRLTAATRSMYSMNNQRHTKHFLCSTCCAVAYLQRRAHFDSADYYMQREGKLSSDVLLPNNPSPQLASPLLERPTLLVTSRPSRLGCSR